MVSLFCVSADLEKCTGCKMCSLACSYIQRGGFNPRYAKIFIESELIGLPRRIFFTQACDLLHFAQCKCETEPPCVKYCHYEALERVALGFWGSLVGIFAALWRKLRKK